MHTWVYKGRKKPDTYLYIDRENDFSKVPDGLLGLLGELSLVIDIELHDDLKLAQVDAREVIRQLNGQGFFLQLPPGEKSIQKPC